MAGHLGWNEALASVARLHVEPLALVLGLATLTERHYFALVNDNALRDVVRVDGD